MKIFLISANRCTEPYAVFPLGLATIAEALHRAGHKVETFDCLWDSKLENRLRTFAPDMVGISLRNIDNENSVKEEWYLDDARQLVECTRSVSTAPVVMGGAGFSVMPEAILAYTGADYGVAGEGEQVMVNLANAATQGKWPAEKILRDKHPLTGSAIMSGTFDARWVRQYLQHGGGCGVQTKRGCPHRCVYCSYPVIEGHALRPRNPLAVVDDVEKFSRLDQNGSVFFTDSVFNDDQGFFLEIIAELERRGSRTPWSAYFKPTGLTEELIVRMKKTGLKSVEMGSDGASDTALRGLGKQFSFEDVERCNRLLTAQNIPTAHFFMFGGPEETEESVLEGVANLQRLERAVIFPFAGIRILPKTLLMKRALMEGILSPDMDLLAPVYYFSPKVDRKWLLNTLEKAFKNTPNIVFPPDSMQALTQALRAMGHRGSLWELMVNTRKSRSRAKSLPIDDDTKPVQLMT